MAETPLLLLMHNRNTRSFARLRHDAALASNSARRARCHCAGDPSAGAATGRDLGRTYSASRRSTEPRPLTELGWRDRDTNGLSGVGGEAPRTGKTGAPLREEFRRQIGKVS